MTQPSNAIEVVPDFPEALPGRRRCRLGRRRRRRRRRPGQRVEALGRRRDDHVTARRRRQQRRRKRQIGGGNVDEAVVGGRQVQGLLDEREQLLVDVVGWTLDASARSGNRRENLFPISTPITASLGSPPLRIKSQDGRDQNGMAPKVLPRVGELHYIPYPSLSSAGLSSPLFLALSGQRKRQPI